MQESQKFNAILCYIMSLGSSWDTEDPVSSPLPKGLIQRKKTILCKTESSYIIKLKH